VGQAHLLGESRPLRAAIETGELHSMILWGPPGTGKTTLARLFATHARAHFATFSAVLSGVKEIRGLVAEAEERLTLHSQRTILFVDEIHRFNKAQQDAFLPHVERGTIILIGATTENPSFEVISALLSRCRVYVLERLTQAEVEAILHRALSDAERGLGGLSLEIDPEALRAIARLADGDARSALNIFEVAATLTTGPRGPGRLTPGLIHEAAQRKALLYDKAGEEHFNLISALHKSVRDSDPDGALYWLARMLEAGEDPLYLARRLVRMASEDVGNADPQALTVALAGRPNSGKSSLYNALTGGDAHVEAEARGGDQPQHRGGDRAGERLAPAQPATGRHVVDGCGPGDQGRERQRPAQPVPGDREQPAEPEALGELRPGTEQRVDHDHAKAGDRQQHAAEGEHEPEEPLTQPRPTGWDNGYGRPG